MNERSETSRFRCALVTAVLFIACGCLVWTELKYAMLGRAARARVIAVHRSTALYQFVDGRGRPGFGRADLPAGMPVAVGDELRVRYVPPPFGDVRDLNGGGDVRLAGSGDWRPLALFAVAAAAASICGYRLWRIAHWHTARSRAFERFRPRS
ncbi:MAG: hypothetical protein WED34_05810 [Planctomycetales bacterium]